jgi:hypothetical protein
VAAAEFERLVRSAVDLGVSLFDTAAGDGVESGTPEPVPMVHRGQAVLPPAQGGHRMRTPVAASPSPNERGPVPCGTLHGRDTNATGNLLAAMLADTA